MNSVTTIPGTGSSSSALSAPFRKPLIEEGTPDSQILFSQKMLHTPTIAETIASNGSQMAKPKLSPNSNIHKRLQRYISKKKKLCGGSPPTETRESDQIVEINRREVSGRTETQSLPRTKEASPLIRTTRDATRLYTTRRQAMIV